MHIHDKWQNSQQFAVADATALICGGKQYCNIYDVYDGTMQGIKYDRTAVGQ